jgi:hypothetical protein
LTTTFPLILDAPSWIERTIEVREAGRWREGVIHVTDEAIGLAWRVGREIRVRSVARGHLADVIVSPPRSHGASLALDLSPAGTGVLLVRCRQRPQITGVGWGIRLADPEPGIQPDQLFGILNEWIDLAPRQ